VIRIVTLNILSVKDLIDSLRALFKGYKGSYKPTLELDDQPKGNEEW
jgi:hypothetical protein